MEIYADITRETYDRLYALTDKAAREISNAAQPLHKAKNKANLYKTTAFSPLGFLEICFQKEKKFKKYKIRLKLKPIRLLHPNSNIRLSNLDDFKKISTQFQYLFYSHYNDHFDDLPSCLGDWKVTRIDYAINIHTNYVNEYIKLFHLGFRPKSCKYPSDYETSYYLKGTEYNVNFYNKLKQLREVKDISYEELFYKTNYNSDRIMRLEVQCKSKYIYRFIEKGIIPSTKLKYLWDKEIAERCIKNVVKKLIGAEDFCTIDAALKKIHEKHENKFTVKCYEVMSFFLNYPEASLEDAVQGIPFPEKLKRLIAKMRKDGINPIPLDAVIKREIYDKNFTLKNPYHMINFK